MKKILGMLAILSIMFFTAGAQNSVNDNGRKHGNKDRRQMMKDMNLSKQQKQEMKAFMKNNKAKKEAIQNDKSLSAQDRKMKMMQLRKEQQEKMSTILTPEQREKMKNKMMEERKNNQATSKQMDPPVKNNDK